MRFLFLLKEWIKYPKMRGKLSSTLDRFSQEDLQKIVLEKRDALLRHAVETVPFYRQLVEGGSLDPKNLCIEDFPILEKKDIRGREELFVSNQYNVNKLSASRTSGSTGEPFKFYRDDTEFDATYIDLWRGLARVGIRHGDKRALVKGVDENPNPSWVTRLRRWAYGVINQCIVIDAHFLAKSEENITISLNRIRKYHPVYLHGYVSSIDLLAAYAERIGFDMKDVGIKVVVTESEKLYDFQRERIARVFGCKVVENYGSVEFGMIAQPDTEGNLCINETHCYVETDADGSAVYTNLDAYAFPFIRFKNGDAITLRKGKKSSLPYREIEHVDGRVADAIQLPNGTSLQGFIVMYPISKHMQYITAYQVRQEKRDELQILLVLKDCLPEAIQNQILSEMQEIVGQDVKIWIKIVDKIPLTKRGKRRFIYSDLKD